MEIHLWLHGKSDPSGLDPSVNGAWTACLTLCLASVTVKPIFHLAVFGRVRADNVTDFALGTFQILF